jgi:hypothetical protein
VIVPIVYAEALDLFEEHRRALRDLWLVSSSGEEIVRPIADHLGIPDVIATRARIDEQGRYDGTLEFYAYAANKATAIRQVAEARGYDLDRCYAYSDSITDLPMLTVVDVDGVWADSMLACDHPTGEHYDYEWAMTDAPVPPGRKGDLVDLAREDLPRELGEDGASRRGDQLEMAGYRDATSTVRLVRGGKVLALIYYLPDGQGGWHVGGVEYCD